MIARVLKFVLAVIFLGLVKIANAQEFGFGLKGGLNLSNLNVDDPEASYDSRTGFHAGIFLRGKFNKVGIQPEVLLFTQSNEISYPANFGTIKNSFTYLSVPVILKFYLISGLNIQTGPQFGFLLDGEQKYETIVFTGKQDIKDAYKKSDVSLSLGGGFDFGFGLNVDVRYNIGVKDINDQSDGEEAKSQVFLISLGWNFVK